MDENKESVEGNESNHPLIVGYHDWKLKRCSNQTSTTIQAIHDAYLVDDVELLEVYDRLLSTKDKDGAWIKHIVKTIRKNPDLGKVSSITKDQLRSYAAMRKAINAVIYANGRKPTKEERNWDQENDLQRFAITYPEHAEAVISVMGELKTLDLEVINGLLTERLNSHNALSMGAL